MTDRGVPPARFPAHLVKGERCPIGPLQLHTWDGDTCRHCGGSRPGVPPASPEAQLEKLPEKWRRDAECWPPFTSQSVIKAYRSCADELEGALSALRVTREAP